MKKILVVVDMQNDFVDENVLGNAETKAIVPKIVKKLKEHGKDYNVIFFTRDVHFDNYLETLEGQKLPIVHCINGTRGSQIVHEIYECIKDLKKDRVSAKIVEKHKFASKELVDYLSCLCGKNDTVEFCGVYTDGCVISNVLAARMELPNTKLVIDFDCCAGSSPDANNAAMWICDSCQIDVISYEE